MLYGTDIMVRYDDSEDTLFRDEDRFKEKPIVADIFDESPYGSLRKTAGAWAVIDVYMFRHIFNLADQTRTCTRILYPLKPEGGAYVIGMKIAALRPEEVPLIPLFMVKAGEKKILRHGKGAFVEMWKGVGWEERVDLEI